jgi:hypothetical protein
LYGVRVNCGYAGWPMAGHAGYSATPLHRKLGIAPGHRVLLDGAPADFALTGLPPGVTVHRRAVASQYQIIMVFCPARARLAARWPVLHRRTPADGALWVAWLKRASGLKTDLDETGVRAFVLANGRVDVKVCAVDDRWSALKSVIRRSDR